MAAAARAKGLRSAPLFFRVLLELEQQLAERPVDLHEECMLDDVLVALRAAAESIDRGEVQLPEGFGPLAAPRCATCGAPINPDAGPHEMCGACTYLSLARML